MIEGRRGVAEGDRGDLVGVAEEEEKQTFAGCEMVISV